jgi:2-polyprenyl-3-methyl-5-hydroxy-6-metoxy-1,4-benzoquinol methylase
VRELERTRLGDEAGFRQLGNKMLQWSERALGPDHLDDLIYGYCEFVIDVNRSQLLYEQQRRYEHSSFAEVFEKAYSNEEFMQLYHWGVYLTTFVWSHHLRIYRFFENEFLQPLSGKKEHGSLLDLGAGSGIWHLLAGERLNGWDFTAVDISQPTIDRSRKMASSLARTGIEHVCADALTFEGDRQFDASISCFLLEHLENPEMLLKTMARNLKPGGIAFITSALTAAEIDHIKEFRRESELVVMLENCGFRVTRMYSSEPDNVPKDRYFLPRSIAFVAQKRTNEIW